jgi:hypothetical protein
MVEFLRIVPLRLMRRPGIGHAVSSPVASQPPQCSMGIVARRLALEWSPEQIAGWLKREFPGHEALQVSHETIYRNLFIQGPGRAQERITGASPIPT